MVQCPVKFPGMVKMMNSSSRSGLCNIQGVPTKKDNQYHNQDSGLSRCSKQSNCTSNQVHFFVYQLYNEPVLKRQKKCRLSRQARLNQINYINTKNFLSLVR